MNVVIIGSGNVAHVLGRKILDAQHNIVQVVERNKRMVSSLATELNADACFDLRSMSQSGDIYIIAVSDSALIAVAEQIKFTAKIVVHTAGAVSKNVLQDSSRNYGVLYPIQTLRKEIQHEISIPMLIDGSNEITIQKLKEFATSWSREVMVANDDERLKLHVAAVVVSNFTNHLFALAKDYCDKEGLHFNLLQPMIEETVRRLKDNEPSAMQTGPASRNDMATVEKHLEMLKAFPQLAKVYRLLTESIVNYNPSLRGTKQSP